MSRKSLIVLSAAVLGLGCQKSPQPPRPAARAIGGLMPAGLPGGEKFYVEDQGQSKLNPARKVSYEPLEKFRAENRERMEKAAAPNSKSMATAEGDDATGGDSEKPEKKPASKKASPGAFLKSLADSAMKVGGAKKGDKTAAKNEKAKPAKAEKKDADEEEDEDWEEEDKEGDKDEDKKSGG